MSCVMLTGKTCSKCILAKDLLKKEGLLEGIEIYDIDSTVGIELVKKFNITSIPAFIFSDNYVVYDLAEVVKKLQEVEAPIIIMISGKTNSGKGTVADLLYSSLVKFNGRNIIRCSLSTYIRELAKKDFYWDGIDTPESRKFMAEVYRLGTAIYPYHMIRRVWERDIVPSLDPVKQNVVILESFREIQNYEYLKQLQEQNKIKKIITIRVERPNYINDSIIDLVNHVSEIALDDFSFDIHIYNIGSIEDLKDKVYETVNTLYSMGI